MDSPNTVVPAEQAGERSDVLRGGRTGGLLGPYAVSVILATYNRAYCLRRAIDSVLNQTFRDFELIVIDDGSADDTKALVEGYDDPRLVFFHNSENRGASYRLNEGIRVARAPLIAFQDSDDEWLMDKLEKQVAAMRAAPAGTGVVYCDRRRIADGGEPTVSPAVHITPEDGLIYDWALNGGVFNTATQSLLIKRECFDVVGAFDPRVPVLNDLELLYRLSKVYFFQRVAEPLVNYYISDDALSRRGEGTAIDNWEVIYEKYRDDLSRLPARKAKLAYWIGSFNMRASHAAKGRAYLAEALRTQPLHPRYFVAYLLGCLGSRVYGFIHRRLK